MEKAKRWLLKSTAYLLVLTFGCCIGDAGSWLLYWRTMDICQLHAGVVKVLSDAAKHDKKFSDICQRLLSSLPNSTIEEVYTVRKPPIRQFELRAKPILVGWWHGGPVSLTFRIATNLDGTIIHFTDVTPPNDNW